MKQTSSFLDYEVWIINNISKLLHFIWWFIYFLECIYITASEVELSLEQCVFDGDSLVQTSLSCFTALQSYFNSSPNRCPLSRFLSLKHIHTHTHTHTHTHPWVSRWHSLDETLLGIVCVQHRPTNINYIKVTVRQCVWGSMCMCMCVCVCVCVLRPCPLSQRTQEVLVNLYLLSPSSPWLQAQRDVWTIKIEVLFLYNSSMKNILRQFYCSVLTNWSKTDPAECGFDKIRKHWCPFLDSILHVSITNIKYKISLSLSL